MRFQKPIYAYFHEVSANCEAWLRFNSLADENLKSPTHSKQTVSLPQPPDCRGVPRGHTFSVGHLMPVISPTSCVPFILNKLHHAYRNLDSRSGE